MKKRLHIILIQFLLFSYNFAFAQTFDSNQTFNLFSESNESFKSLPVGDEDIQRMTIRINNEIMKPGVVSRGDKLLIELFSGESLEASVTRVDQNIMGTTNIIGRISSEVFPGSIIITFDKDDRLFATVNMYDENRLFEIKSDPVREEHYLVEKDKEAMEPMECGGVITIEEDYERDRIDF